MEFRLPRDWGMLPWRSTGGLSTDLSSIESPVVRTVIERIFFEKEKRGFHFLFLSFEHDQKLAELLKTARTTGVLVDVLRMAIKYNVLTELLEGALEGDVMKDVLVEAKKSGLLSQVVEHCDVYTATSLVTGAVECGMLNDVLRTAVECGNVKTVLFAAGTVDVMKDVLVEAKKSGVLSQVVKHCDEYTATSLARGAIECGMLNDILVGAKERRQVREILKETETFFRTKDSLMGCVKRCNDRPTAERLISSAIQCGVLNDVLREAVKLGKVGILVETTLKKPYFSSLMIRRQYPEILDTLQILLEEAVNIGAFSVVLTEVMNGRQFQFVLEMVAKKLLGLHNLGENTEVVSNLLGSLLSHAEASGELRRYLVVLQRLNVPREYIEQAAKDQAILKEVLEAERLIELFDIFIFVFTLVSVTSNARSKDKGHCSSEHRKHVIDHVTIRSGDIEANPGPVFYFNDWLKEMFALAVSLVCGFQGKNIQWQKLGIPNPHNGLDRSELKALFNDHAQIVRDAEPLIPSTHTEEFRLLKTYIETGRDLDQDQLEKLVVKRKVKVTWQEFLKGFQSLSQSDQEEVVQHLDTEQMGFKLVNMREQSEDGDDTGDVLSEDEEGVNEDLGHQEVSEQVGEPTEIENRSAPVGDTGHFGDSDLLPALLATSGSQIKERGLSEGSGQQAEPKPEPSREQAYGGHRTTDDRTDFCDPETSQQQGTSPPGSQQQGTSPPGSQQQGTSPPGSQQQGTSPPGSQELSANESEPLDIWQVQGIFDYLELEATARHVECQPEADGIPQDILELLLDEHTSGTTEDTNSSMQTDAHNKLTNGNDCGVSVRKDGSSSGQDRVADEKTQPDLSNDSMKWRQLNHRHEILLHNFERVTGLQNADQRRYDIVDIEIPVSCRKRQPGSNMLQDDVSVSKYTKFQ